MAQFMVTRPTLAMRLMNSGIEGELTAHPFDKTKKAWLFDADARTVAIARSYYEEIGKPLPRSLSYKRLGDMAQ